MRIALAQLNPIIGDVSGNLRLVKDAIDHARQRGANLVLFSEMVVLGYPPRDLLLRKGVVEACEYAVQDAATYAAETAIVIGHPRRRLSSEAGTRPLANSLSVCHRGRVIKVYDKRLLPGYDVFDEDRYFEPGRDIGVVELFSKRIGLLICEDLWRAGDANFMGAYTVDPVAELARERCDLVLALNASPFVVGKGAKHVTQLREAAGKLGCDLISVNQVGANDDLIFDGRSMIVNRDAGIRTILAAWKPDLAVVDCGQDVNRNGEAEGAHRAFAISEPATSEELFHALVLGIRDYVRKTGNSSVALGLSGGIDSALVATLAAAALGPSNVIGVSMPSRYSSEGSRSDALELVNRLGMPPLISVPIEALHVLARDSMQHMLPGGLTGVADENTQARLRGMVLMAFSNSTGCLVLATGNKSELATGYCTLYGDMCGALCVLGDVVKTRAYDLARWINDHHAALGFAQPPIPEASISKPPSAELKANQTDQDTLPPYEVLDAIVVGVVEREQSIEQIVKETGIDPAVVRRWANAIDQQQYKRDQAALVLKVTARAFGRGRPMPMAARCTLPAREDSPHGRAVSCVSTGGEQIT